MIHTAEWIIHRYELISQLMGLIQGIWYLCGHSVRVGMDSNSTWSADAGEWLRTMP